MRGRWSEHRLLVAIGVLAIAAAVHEVAWAPGADVRGDTGPANHALVARYPDAPRMQFKAAMQLIREERLTPALPLLAAAFDGDYREDELLYHAYIDLLMVTGGDQARIDAIVDRWRRDFPTSQKRERTEARLREARGEG